MLVTAIACVANAAPASAESPVPVTRANVDAAIAALDADAADVLHRSGVPGMAIAVVRDGGVVYLKGFGVRKYGTNLRVDPDTVFLLASVSKSLASTVVAGAVGDGKVKWSDPVASHLAGFTLRDPWVGSHVTIGDMFAHRSGLPDHAGDALEDIGYSRAEIIERLRLEPLGPFRDNYEYTNFGLTAGAQAVADAEGTTWEDLSARLLYAPLGMTHTSSRWSDYNAAPDKATIHVRTSTGWKTSDRDADAQSPAGGASSTVRDLARWMILELQVGKFGGKQLIDRDALLATQQPQVISSRPKEPGVPAGFYGFGMNVGYDTTGRLRLSHSGAFALGTGTAFELLPSKHLGIVVLTNGAPSGVPEAICKAFYDRVEFGKTTRDWYAFIAPQFERLMAEKGKFVGKTPPSNPAASAPLNELAGMYSNDYYGWATVVVREGALDVELGPRKRAYRLTHWNGNEFALRTPGENGTLSAVTFEPAGGDGPARFTIEAFDANGLGTFTKVAR